MPYGLLALDLDDTLLRDDLSISEGNREALRAAHRKGARIVLASGRTIHSMAAYARALGLDGPDDYLIASNGAELLEAATGRLLHQTRLDAAVGREAAAFVTARGFPWQVYVGGRILYSARNDWTEEDTRLTGMPNLPLADPEAVLSEPQVKFVVPGEPAAIRRLLAETSAALEGRAEVLISKPCFMEILAPGVDKGAALGRLAAILGIPLTETIACGDAMNDLGMLRAAGLGCAPANAIPAAREAARHVSELTNDQDFVADVVRRFIL